MKIRDVSILTAAFLLLGPGSGSSSAWDFSNSEIPVDQIQSGGPPRDGIPALTSPVMVPAAEAGFLVDDEKVLGLEINGDARAYPLRILSWHELVTSSLRGRRVRPEY